jgi:integrase
LPPKSKSLNDIELKSLKPRAKSWKRFDGQGLYIEITPAGKKYWRFKYRFNGKEKRLSLGTYPLISLKEARRAANEVRIKLTKDIDPSAERQARKQREIELAEHSFAAIAHEWHVKKYSDKEPGYAKRVWRALEKDIFPFVGQTPVSMISGPGLRKALIQIEDRGAIESAHRALQICGRIYGYANACGYCTNDPTRGLKTVLSTAPTKHFASILDPVEIGGLLRAIDGYDSPITRAALRLNAYTFVRPGNLRQAEWSEFTLDENTWKIPEEKMKMRKPHIVPLANQVVTLLEELQPLTGNGQYVFPGERSKLRPMSEATTNAALRRMGYAKEKMTGHGWRHMASTLLNEQSKWNPDAIERQLAHTDRSKIRGTYDHSKHLAERRRMMQSWADYLDSLKNKSNVISINAYESKKKNN